MKILSLHHFCKSAFYGNVETFQGFPRDILLNLNFRTTTVVKIKTRFGPFFFDTPGTPSFVLPLALNGVIHFFSYLFHFFGKG